MSKENNNDDLFPDDFRWDTIMVGPGMLEEERREDLAAIVGWTNSFNEEQDLKKKFNEVLKRIESQKKA